MSWNWFFSRLSVLPVTRYGESLCYAVLLPSMWQKLRGATSRLVAIICIVSQLITNYPLIITFCGNNSNVHVGTCPDPSS